MCKFLRNRVKKCHTEEALQRKAQKKAEKQAAKKQKEENIRMHSIEAFERKRERKNKTA